MFFSGGRCVRLAAMRGGSLPWLFNIAVARMKCAGFDLERRLMTGVCAFFSNYETTPFMASSLLENECGNCDANRNP